MTALAPFVALLTAVLLALPVGAQETPPDPQDPKAAAPQDPQNQEPAETQEPEVFQVPDEVAAALEVDPKEMRERIADLAPEQLSVILADWMELVRRQQAAFKEASAAEEGSEQRASADGVGTDRDALIARAEAVIEVLVEKGGEVKQARETIRSIREAETKAIERALERGDGSTVPQDQTKAQTVDLEILKARLRPLRVEQVEQELTAWMELLQKKCLEVGKAEVAGITAEDVKDNEDIDKFNAAAVALRAERDNLIRRVNVVIDSYEAKAGDETRVKQSRSYVDNVVETPPVTGFRATWIRLRTWLTSEDGGIAVAINLGLFVLILVAFRLIGVVVSRILNRTLRALGKTPELLRDFFVNMTRKIILLVGFMVALGQIGVDVTPLIAAIGGAAFVIGFALQGTLSNFASGLMILMYRPYNVGDVVEISGTTGTVARQNLVSTTIKTFDNKIIVVPNNKIWGDIITNATASPTRRVDMVFGIGYADDMAKAEAILRDVVEKHEKVLADPAPAIRVHELGDSSVNFIVRPWTKTEDYWGVYWDVTRAVKERFDQEGVTIPFPQRDVHVYHEAVGNGADPLLLPRPERGGAKGQSGAKTTDGGLDDAETENTSTS